MGISNFLDHTQAAFKKTLDFKTRSSRAEYWSFTGLMIIAMLVAIIGDIIIMGVDNLDNGPVQSLLTIVLILPSLSVSVRRLHDVGRSGWWVCIPLVPILGILLFIYWALKPGEDGSNKYGQNPLAYSGDKTRYPEG